MSHFKDFFPDNTDLKTKEFYDFEFFRNSSSKSKVYFASLNSLFSVLLFTTQVEIYNWLGTAPAPPIGYRFWRGTVI